jgi:hypothetical protein
MSIPSDGSPRQRIRGTSTNTSSLPATHDAIDIQTDLSSLFSSYGSLEGDFKCSGVGEPSALPEPLQQASQCDSLGYENRHDLPIGQRVWQIEEKKQELKAIGLNWYDHCHGRLYKRLRAIIGEEHIFQWHKHFSDYIYGRTSEQCFLAMPVPDYMKDIEAINLQLEWMKVGRDNLRDEFEAVVGIENAIVLGYYGHGEMMRVDSIVPELNSDWLGLGEGN